MAFCKYCGNKLEDGQVCSCPEAVAAREAEAGMTNTDAAAESKQPVEEQPNTDPNVQIVTETAKPATEAKPITITIPAVDKEQVKGQMKEFWGAFAAIIKAPSTGGAAFLSGENRNSALVFVGVQVFLSAILSCCYIGNINSVLSGMGGGLFSRVTDEIKFSGVQAFFVTLLFAAVAAVLFAAIFWLVALVAKLKISLNHAIEIAGIRAVYNIPVILVAILSAFLEVRISIALYMAAAVFVMAFVQGALTEKYPEKKNLLTYLIIVAVAIFVFVMTIILSKGIMLYVPKAVKERMNGGLSGSLMNFL